MRLQRRHWQKASLRKSLYAGFKDCAEPDTLDQKEVYRPARRESSSAFAPTALDAAGSSSKDELRRLRYAAFLRREGTESRVAEDENAEEGALDSQ